MNPITLFASAALISVGVVLDWLVHPFLVAPFVVTAVILALSLKMANAWERFVILRAGKLQRVQGPGLFAIVPIVDNVAAIIDERIQTTAFNAEQALTKDTVPVNVDAIIFWHVHDAQKAALAIADYRQAIDRVAQTSLREMIGSSMLAALLSDRKTAHERLRDEIGRKTAEWGISVTSVKIRDVAIPVALQDAMSRQAQAEREKQARVIRIRRSGDRGQVRGGIRDLWQPSSGAATSRHEHHLRDGQGARHHDLDADRDDRQHEPGRRLGAGGSIGSRSPGRPIAQEPDLGTAMRPPSPVRAD